MSAPKQPSSEQPAPAQPSSKQPAPEEKKQIGIRFPESGRPTARLWTFPSPSFKLDSLKKIHVAATELYKEVLDGREFYICQETKFGLTEIDTSLGDWVVGDPNQVYTIMLSNDEDVIYENQRSYPFKGYSNALLPTDKAYHWSGKDVGNNNCVEMSKERKVPSGWEYYSEWTVAPVQFPDDSVFFKTKELKDAYRKEGWYYAVDFIWDFHVGCNSMDWVRRRKWVRKRRLIEHVCPACQQRFPKASTQSKSKDVVESGK